MSESQSILYDRATVMRVIFQLKFANIFLIENRIGEYQAKIMEKFPESSLTIRRPIILTDSNQNIESIPSDEEFGRKIWQFKSEKNYILSITTNSLDITSDHHKSYDDRNGNGFRSIIDYAVNNFLALIPIKLFKRIGLRYIDDSPINKIESTNFKEWYNTTFPLERFKIEDVSSMNVEVRAVKRGEYFLNYNERIIPLKTERPKFQYILDFDGFKEDVLPKDYLNILDDLHKLIHSEWEDNTIKQPVKDWMNKKIELEE